MRRYQRKTLTAARGESFGTLKKQNKAHVLRGAKIPISRSNRVKMLIRLATSNGGPNST